MMLRMMMAGGEAPPPVSSWFDIVTWTGAGASTATIPTDLDLSDGALVWVKRRDAAGAPTLYFRASDVGDIYSINMSATTAPAVVASAALGDGSFTVPDDISGATYVAWVFKKSVGNFMITPYTGNGVQGRKVAHGLGVKPVFAFAANMTGTSFKYAQHEAVDAGSYIRFDNSANVAVAANIWAGSPMDSVEITLGNSTLINGTGTPAVLFTFGGPSVEAPSFIGNGSQADVSGSFQPDFLIVRRATSGTNNNWQMFDQVRSPGFSGNDASVAANTTAAENSGSNLIGLITDGFSVATGVLNTPSAQTICLSIKK